MPKAELEFFKPDHLPWEPVAASAAGGAGGAGVKQKILSRNEEGDVGLGDADDARDVPRSDPDACGGHLQSIDHYPFAVWILEGALTDLGKKQTFTAGMYACRPPGMVHGPYRVPKRCVTLELRYFKR